MTDEITDAELAQLKQALADPEFHPDTLRRMASSALPGLIATLRAARATNHLACRESIDDLNIRHDILECENTALRARVAELDSEWQQHLAYLHPDHTGDGCESGDPRDWTAAAIGLQQRDLENKRDALARQLKEATAYLTRLFQAVAPQCEPLPTLIGLCTQIDNYGAGLKQQLTDAQALLQQRHKWAAPNRIAAGEMQLLNWEEFNEWWNRVDDFFAAVEALVGKET